METPVAKRKETRDHPAYFLAGHTAPAGVYREMQTGREIHLEEADILPATCNGRVAVYLRQPTAWSERGSSEERDRLRP